MRRKSKGVRSLAGVATLQKTEIVAGDAGLRYSGLARFQKEEAAREAAAKKEANAAKFDALVTGVNDPGLYDRCSIAVEIPDPEVNGPRLIAEAWERFEKRKLGRFTKETVDKIMALFRRIIFRNRELAWVSADSSNQGTCDATWDATWDYLVELGLLDRLGLVKPAPQKQVDEFEKLNGETRAGLEAMKNAVYEEVFSQDVSSVRAQFVDFLKKQFSFEPNKFQTEWILRFITDNNLPWLDGDSRTRARVAAVKKGILPLSLLTDDERLTWKIEDEPTSLTDFETQQKYLRKLHRRDTVEPPDSLRSSTDVSLGRR